MQTIMLGLTTVPGVMGGMLSDERGNVLAHSFPPLFDQVTLKGAADLLLDNTVGLQEATGGVKLFDMRFELGRIIIKTLPRMFLVILCQPTVNVQLLFISINVAIKKIEKLSADNQLAQAAQQAQPQVQTPPAPVARPASAASAYSGYRAVTDEKGVLLSCEILQKTAGMYWASMSDSASVNRDTALEISNFFNTGPFKKLTMSNRVTGVGKHVPVAVIQHDRDHAYDGKVLLTLALAELLKVKEGDQIRAEVVHGGGFLGWEGI
ncbi:MAG: roadblock/LC7 domain-containing protein [Desulfuromonadales bacterium]|nr:roadblock/LC7 domain-containing protein [Desulfuromonadales bacterium]